MLVAKLKGIALAVGTMTAVVSGAVVLAQSGAGPGPGPGAGPTGPSAETRVEARRDPDGRAAALEQKLDRVLEALERLSKPTSPPVAGERRRPDAAAGERRRPDAIVTSLVEAPAVSVENAPTAPADSLPPPVSQPPEGPLPSALQPDPAQEIPRSVNRLSLPPSSPGPQGPPTRQASMADRLQLLEQQMRQVQQHLERLDARLKALDARVGGPEIENLPAPGTAGPGPGPATS